jgi:hypothetical protein
MSNGMEEFMRRRKAFAAEEAALGYPPHTCMGHAYPLPDCKAKKAHLRQYTEPGGPLLPKGVYAPLVNHVVLARVQTLFTDDRGVHYVAYTISDGEDRIAGVMTQNRFRDIYPTLVDSGDIFK